MIFKAGLASFYSLEEVWERNQEKKIKKGPVVP
jgi:hypothetical protein